MNSPWSQLFHCFSMDFPVYLFEGTVVSIIFTPDVFFETRTRRPRTQFRAEVGCERAIFCNEKSSCVWNHERKGSLCSVFLLELVSQAIGVDVKLGHQRQPVVGYAVILMPFNIDDPTPVNSLSASWIFTRRSHSASITSRFANCFRCVPPPRHIQTINHTLAVCPHQPPPGIGHVCVLSCDPNKKS